VAIRGIQEGHPKAPHILSNQGGGYGFDNCPYLNQKSNLQNRLTMMRGVSKIILEHHLTPKAVFLLTARTLQTNLTNKGGAWK